MNWPTKEWTGYRERIRFALLPMKADDGRTYWLESIWTLERYSEYWCEGWWSVLAAMPANSSRDTIAHARRAGKAAL